MPRADLALEPSVRASSVFPLTQAETRQRVLISEVVGEDLFVKRLASLGLVVGSNLQVLNMGKWGLTILLNDSARLAVDPQLAGSIWVAPAA